MTKSYRYIGELQIELAGVGTVEPQQVVEVDHELVHPLFEEVKTKEQGNKKK